MEKSAICYPCPIPWRQTKLNLLSLFLPLIEVIADIFQPRSTALLDCWSRHNERFTCINFLSAILDNLIASSTADGLALLFFCPALLGYILLYVETIKLSPFVIVLPSSTKRQSLWNYRPLYRTTLNALFPAAQIAVDAIRFLWSIWQEEFIFVAAVYTCIYKSHNMTRLAAWLYKIQ